MKTFTIGSREITCQYSLLTEVIYKREFGDALRTDISKAEKVFFDYGIDIKKKKEDVMKQIASLDQKNYIAVMNALSDQFEIFIQILYASAIAGKSIDESYEDFINQIPVSDLTPEFMAEVADFVKKGISPKKKEGPQRATFRKK